MNREGDVPGAAVMVRVADHRPSPLRVAASHSVGTPGREVNHVRKQDAANLMSKINDGRERRQRPWEKEKADSEVRRRPARQMKTALKAQDCILPDYDTLDFDSYEEGIKKQVAWAMGTSHRSTTVMRGLPPNATMRAGGGVSAYPLIGCRFASTPTTSRRSRTQPAIPK